MSSLTQFKNEMEAALAAVRSKALAAVPSDIMFSALGSYIVYGCKVTGTTASPQNRTIWLSGQAAGDSVMLNPNLSLTPTRGFQYPNIASLADGAFRSLDTSVDVQAAPATGTARYDIAYIFVGPGGAGLAIVTGTPSSAVKTDYDTNGLDSSAYGEATITDPALPVGALPVARIYVEDVFVGVNNAQIADIRPLVAGADFGGVDAVRLAAEAARDLAQEWAVNPENDPVTGSGSPQQFSAKHHAIKAAASAATATSAKDLAREWASNAENTPVTGSGSPQQFSAKHHAIKAAASAALAAAIAASGLAASVLNGVVYLNSGGVLTTGSGLQFDPASLGLTVAAGSGNTRRLGFDTSGVFYNWIQSEGASAGDATLSFAVNNTKTLYLTPAGLGIGTSTVTEKLTVAGNAIFTGNYVSFGNNGYIRTDAADELRFQCGSAGYVWRDSVNSTTLMGLTNSGNLGLGVTPSAWASAFKAMQIGTRTHLSQSSNSTYLGNNAYYNGTNWIYQTSSYANQFSVQEDGSFIWQTAPSGTAGNAITFTQAMTLDAGGGLLVGRTSSAFHFDVAAVDGNIASFAYDGSNSVLEISSPTTNKIRLWAGSGDTLALGSANDDLIIDASGNLIQKLNASAPTLGTNSTMTFELTSNTSLTVKVRGSDGTTRSGTITLS